MQNQTLARRYATAVFNLANAADSIEVTGRDLGAAADAMYGSDDVRRFYLSPVIGRMKKEEVLRAAFEGKLGMLALHSLLLLVRKRREALLVPIVSEYAKLALAHAGREPLEIVSARDLAPNELNGIVVRLSRSYGKAFTVTQRTDPSLLGGIRITMGDRRIDGSLAARIDDLGRELVGRSESSLPGQERYT